MAKEEKNALNSADNTNRKAGSEQGQDITKTDMSSSVVRFSKFNIPDKYAELKQPNTQRRKFDFVLDWENYRELEGSHGLAVCYSVLISKNLNDFDEPQFLRLFMEIEKNIGADKWRAIKRDLSQFEDWGVLKNIYLLAVWAQLFEKANSEVWLAAMALYAHYILGDEYAFAYMTAQIIQLQTTEGLFLRGQKNLAYSRLGGQLKPKPRNPKTARTIAEIERLISIGFTPSNSAAIAFKNKFGSSVDANKKLFSRHKKK